MVLVGQLHDGGRRCKNHLEKQGTDRILGAALTRVLKYIQYPTSDGSLENGAIRLIFETRRQAQGAGGSRSQLERQSVGSICSSIGK